MGPLKKSGRRERNQQWAHQMLKRLKPLQEWLAVKPRSDEELAIVRRLHGELQAMARHGWESSLEVITVNGVVQTVNGERFGQWYASQACGPANRMEKHEQDIQEPAEQPSEAPRRNGPPTAAA